MIVQIRQCCCSLATLVKVTCIIFMLLYFAIALLSVVWLLLFANVGSTSSVVVVEKEDGEINGFEDFDAGEDVSEQNSSFKNLVIFIIVVLFAIVGAFVNLLVICSIRIGKKSLILPWFVFNTFLVIGKNI